MDLSNNQIAILERAFGLERFETCEGLAQALLPLAVGAWLSWLSGEKRYNSLTEQYTDWIDKIYEHLLPQTEAPSVERLFNSFNVPYGQAQYITRVLTNRALASWRGQARKNLKDRLLERKCDVDDWIKEDRLTERVEVVLSKEAATELEIIVDNLLRESPGEVDILRSAGGRNFVAKKSQRVHSRRFASNWALRRNDGGNGSIDRRLVYNRFLSDLGESAWIILLHPFERLATRSNRTGDKMGHQ